MTTQRHMSTGLDRKRCIQTGLLSYSDSPTHPGNSLFHKHIQNLTGIQRRARPRQTGPLSPLELKKFSKPSAPKVSRDPFKHRSTQNSPISSQVTMAKVKLLPPRRRAPQPRLPARLLASLLGSLINSLSFATLVSWLFLKPAEHTLLLRTCTRLCPVWNDLPQDASQRGACPLLQLKHDLITTFFPNLL